MQLLAFGFVSSRTAYFRDPWNWMDAAIVALICIDSYQDIIWFIERNSAYISSINVPTGIKVLRALRALRPLRWVLLRTGRTPQPYRGDEGGVLTALCGVCTPCGTAVLASV